MRNYSVLLLAAVFAAASAPAGRAHAQGSPPAPPRTVPVPPGGVTGGAAGGVAAPKARVAVLEFLVEAEDKAPALALALQDAFLVGLRRTGSTVLDSVDVGRRLETTPELQKCDTAICLKRIGQVLGVTHVYRARVVVEGNSYKMTARLFSTGDATAVVPVENQSRFCDVCTVGEAREMIIRLADAVRRPLDEAPVVIAPAPKAAPRPRPRTGAIASVALGAIATGAGAVLLASGSDGKALAATAGALVGAGVTTAAMGILFLVDGRRERAAGVSVAIRF